MYKASMAYVYIRWNRKWAKYKQKSLTSMVSDCDITVHRHHLAEITAIDDENQCVKYWTYVATYSSTS